jgi:hypothetical protein
MTDERGDAAQPRPEPQTHLRHVEALGRLLRQDPLDQLGVGTPHRIDALIDAGKAGEAKQMVQYFRKEFEVVHDIYAQYVQDLVAFIAEQFGEEQVESAFRSSLERWFKARYDAYNRLTLEERVQLTAEGMRCHLDGPGRQGDFELIEEKERFVFKWDPCGSGGVLRRKAAAEGRTLAAATKAHPWTWNRKGVCLYCSHCSLVNEILPIEHYGYPNRITEYPESPDDPCVWYIYKDPDDIPEEYYARIGKTKPPRRTVRE